MKLLLRRYLLISILTYAFSDTNAQVNSLLDGSFEDTTLEWQDHYWASYCLHEWSNLTDTGWYGNATYCSYKRLKEVAWLRLPNTNNFYQHSYHGFGLVYASLYNSSCITPGLPNVCRTMLRSKLRKPLGNSIQYCITVHVAPREFLNGYLSNGVGIYLDNGGLDNMVTMHGDSSGIYPFVNAQFQCPTIVTDTQNWTEFEKVFIAQGTETWLNLGNFQTDSATLIMVDSMSGGLLPYSDMIVDAISVIPTDLNNWLHDTFTTVGDSVWVGLDKFDYFEGQWYSGDLVPLTKEPGFWLVCLHSLYIK
jgi:hypothetical protein